MNGTVLQEFLLLLIDLAIGAGIGFLFDCYRVLRQLLRPGWLVTQLADFFFWVCCALLTFRVFFVVTGGEINLYNFLIIPLGTVLYSEVGQSGDPEAAVNCLFLAGPAVVLALPGFLPYNPAALAGRHPPPPGAVVAGAHLLPGGNSVAAPSVATRKAAAAASVAGTPGGSGAALAAGGNRGRKKFLGKEGFSNQT